MANERQSTPLERASTMASINASTNTAGAATNNEKCSRGVIFGPQDRARSG